MQITERSEITTENLFERRRSITAGRGFVVQDLSCHTGVKITISTSSKKSISCPKKKHSKIDEFPLRVGVRKVQLV